VKASGTASYSTVASGGNYNAYVMNAGDRKVNFRSQPSKSSAVIAQYPSGKQVYVLAHGEVWDKIEIDGVQGWMMTQYLTTSVPAPTPTPKPKETDSASYYTAYVVSENQKGVHVRKGKSTNYTVLFTVPYGAPVAVLEHGTSWDYIQYNGKKGYMNNQFLQLAKPSNAPAITTLDPSVTPTPTPKFEPYTTTVNVDQLNFHQQKGDWSSNVHKVGRLNKGDVVTVLEISGKWAHIEYKGYKGWVHKEFLD
jgi:Bacterial SH3 domain.